MSINRDAAADARKLETTSQRMSRLEADRVSTAASRNRRGAFQPGRTPDFASNEQEVVDCDATNVSHLVSLVRDPYSVSCLRTRHFSLRYLYQKVVASESKCLRWLAKHGLLQNQLRCSTCDVLSVLVRSQSVWQCPNCKLSKSLRHKSFFISKRLPNTTIVELLYWWSLDASEDVIMSEMDINRHTVSNWFRYCSGLCAQFYKDNPCHLGGSGKVVEVEIREFSAFKSNFPIQILAMVERGSNVAFLSILPDLRIQTCVDLIDGTVQPDSKLASKLPPNYGRFFYGKNLQFVGPEQADSSSETIEHLWMCVESSVRQITSHRHIIEDDLKEIQFRLMTGDKLFGEMLYWLDFYRW